jgi:hypothetical protein
MSQSPGEPRGDGSGGDGSERVRSDVPTSSFVEA